MKMRNWLPEENILVDLKLLKHRFLVMVLGLEGKTLCDLGTISLGLVRPGVLGCTVVEVHT